ncbi:CDP-alcohol phosphatidyltransferase family protein [Pedococcus aerophilus]|uniref:CDP-alcohol phosphatidyltransferase family protein n=1 Tax=Pedococcus aerophilus TaxID=436356 RepID=A0ABP6H565_9MICO
MADYVAQGGLDSRRARARELSASAGKSNRGAPGYSRWVNRPAGRRLAIWAFLLGLTPNQVTIISGLTTLTGIVVLVVAPPTVVTGLVVAFLLALGYALDSADGQLARMRGSGSVTGEWLDHVIDCAKVATLHVAVLLCWYRFYDVPDWALLVPIAFSIQASVYFFTKILSDQLRPPKTAPPEVQQGGEGRPPVLASLLVLPLDYGLLCVTFALLGFHTLFAVAYTALALAGVLLLAAALPKWYRDLARADRARQSV